MTEARIGVVARPQLDPRELLEEVRAVEAAGVEEVWLWEDCFLAGGLVASAAVLAGTRQTGVGLGLMPAPFRNPALAAMEVAACARMFPSRFTPVIGHGVLAWMAQVGARVESPMTLLRETATAVRALLHGEEVSVEGRYVRLDGVRLDWPPADVPPLLLGARGPKTLRLAGEVADGVVLDVDDGVNPTPTSVAASVQTVRQGRDGSPRDGEALQVVVFVEPGPKPARQAVDLLGAGATSVVFQPSAASPSPGSVLDAALAAQAAVSD